MVLLQVIGLWVKITYRFETSAIVSVPLKLANSVFGNIGDGAKVVQARSAEFTSKPKPPRADSFSKEYSYNKTIGREARGYSGPQTPNAGGFEVCPAQDWGTPGQPP